MSNGRIATMEIVELIRLLRAGESDRAIVSLLGLNRRTIARYRRWAREQGLLEGPMPTSARVQQLVASTLPAHLPPQQVSSVAAYADEIAAYRERGLEIAAICARLEEVHGQPVSYHAVWRLVQRQEPPATKAVVRVERQPGEEAQVDFGYAGLTIDPASGARRKSWVFVMTLAWSRHQYAEVVFDQRVETWLLCHRHAFEWFRGVPARIVPDNLKSGIVQASFTEPVAQRAYRECAEHYGFLIDPHPPRTPQHKGKVEQGGVHYVARNFLAGRDPQPRDELNAALRRWCEQTAGRRVHGTTKQAPLERFTAVEQASLRRLPPTPYDLAVWKRVRLYRDCHLVFEGAYSSAPFRLVGQQVWVRGGARVVELYTSDHQWVATHDRVAPGERQTDLTHLPPEKVPNLVISRETCLQQAQAIGPATTQFVQALLDHRPEDRLRTAGRLVRLAQRTSPERLEQACARALAFGAEDYATVKRILDGQWEAADPPPATAPPRPFMFVRQASEFVASVLGGAK